MRRVIYIWKPLGFSPLKTIEKFKEKYPEYKDEIVSYAGRLDPMAEGILVFLIGEENKKRDSYLNLKKEYESEIILGISTDTFDSLGLITKTENREISKKEIEKKLKSFVGKQRQLYPPYSSKAVGGRPLYWWSRQGRLSEIEIPEREVEIYSIELLSFEEIDVDSLVNKIIENIKNIKGDFRQDKIIKSWEEFDKKYGDEEFVKIKIKVSCSSGTYIRRIADDLGGFANTIMRTGIGEIRKKDCIEFIAEK
jgi:tRNA pseudouridine55 synthase